MCPKLLESRENTEGRRGKECGLVGINRRGEILKIHYHSKESKRIEKRQERQSKQRIVRRNRNDKFV